MSIPPTSPLFSSGRLRIGDCVVDVPLREVRAADARHPKRITPKSMGVLRVLVENAGKVVTRDVLMAEVWPDTLPTDDVITQAVTQLRKAFGQQRDARPYIETIAKTGYRLLAPVEWLDQPEASVSGPESGPADGLHAVLSAVPASAPSASGSASFGTSTSTPAPIALEGVRAPQPRWWLRERLLVSVVAVAAVLMLALFLMVRGTRLPTGGDGHGHDHDVRPATPERPYRMLTSSPGFELSPTLSPDASMIAYAATRPGRRGTVIMVQTTDQSQPRQMSHPASGISDRIPAWSPDGREIAFVRYGTGDACGVLVAAASGSGAERRVASCDPDDLVSFDWGADGRSLIFGSMSTGQGTTGLRRLDLQSGRWHALPYPSGGAGLDHAPRYSPDGRWIGFVRNPQIGDLWRIPAEGGAPEKLTHIGEEIRGWDWLPDGRGIVFGRRIDSETRLYLLDLDSGKVRDMGLDDAQSPTVAERTGEMAFVRRRPQFGIFRINRSEASGPARREHLFASSGRDTLPSLAPDGRQLVFSSDRSGHFHLWWADLDNPDSLRQIEDVHPDTHSLPEWSPDSRKVLIVGHDDSGRSGVYELVPASGQVTFLPRPGPEFKALQALYTPDPDRLLMGVRDTQDNLCLALLDRSTSPWRVLAKIEDVSLARVDHHNRRVLFTRLSSKGLWQADLDLSPASVKQVDAERPMRWRFQTWAVAADGTIDYIEAGPDCLARLHRIGQADPADPSPPSRCLNPDHLSTTTGFSSSSRLDAVFASLTVDDGTDIGFMKLPEVAEVERGWQVPGWLK